MNEIPVIDDQSPFWLEDWYIEPSAGRISRLGEEVKLEPKVMTVLVCLAQSQGKVISREELESRAWAGTIVGYDALASTIIKLRKAFGDDSKNSRIIKTVPKKGYCLIAQVRKANKAQEQGSTKSPASSITHQIDPVSTTIINKTSQQPWILVFLTVVLLAGLALGIIQFLAPFKDEGINGAQADKPSIAVLPFKNISDDEQQEYFSDGITSDLITDLSKISGLLVIARNTVFTYKNSEVDVREVGKELGVRYVIEGNVRKAADTVRISARLINASTGYNMWADRFDGTYNNVFALQDEVTAKIVSALQVKLTENERERLAQKYTNSIEAYDNFLHGWQRYWEYSKEGNAQAREYFTKAIELDENFARAYANLALTYAYEAFAGWTDDRTFILAQANKYAQKAIELDDSLPQVHWAAGFTALVDRNYQFAVSEAEKVIALDPNYADGYGLMATTLNYAAKPKDALQYMLKAMRLNPRHPYPYKMILGEIYFNLHDYDNAIENFNLALERNPAAQEPRLWLAAAYAYTGQIEDAQWELQNIRLVNPEIAIAKIENDIPLKDPVQLKHLIDGLYKAGLK
ncbi:MAG: winged helix-turn-helix domain-containing tetratricopeptide repeat protein [Gammaproteobacteria bacterium]|jgi:TolB-like protein/DNA-binding winged helix-turn-helix (wHTH) protein/Tfp pilus assembly protein PilF